MYYPGCKYAHGFFFFFNLVFSGSSKKAKSKRTNGLKTLEWVMYSVEITDRAISLIFHLQNNRAESVQWRRER